jgi:glycosyltransferase involved in cell wall biosynthesis
MDKLTIGLFNDSFPPTLDGVANAVVNYAKAIQKNHANVVVATPFYPDVVDDYPFEVIRYPSANISKRLGYRAGYPFNSAIIARLEAKKIDLIHTHSPFSSTILARVLRYYTGAPIVLTYHTKFDIDIEKRLAFNPARKASVRMLLSNINACDEVWAVSEGAGENLRNLGYRGKCVIMENGADYDKGKSSKEEMDSLREKLGLAEDMPTFLYVGRMMWYKGIRLTVDALRIARDNGEDFRMLFVGEGADRDEIMDYVEEKGLSDRCLFTGAIHDRAELKVYFSIAHLFLFPSTYDTNGIVVREAAACHTASLLVRGSCAAEGIFHEDTGILADEEAGSIAEQVIRACGNLPLLKQIGDAAADRLYLSWEDAVKKAFLRYEKILREYPDSDSKIDADSGMIRRIHLIKERYSQGRLKITSTYRKTEERLKVSVDRLFR